MRLLNWRAGVVIALMIIGSGFQNCSAVKFAGSQESQDPHKGQNIVSYGGDVYGGKPYLLYLTDGLCADGSKIEAIIQGSLQVGFSMTRESCLDLKVAQPIAASRIAFSIDSLVFDNRRYVEAPQALPTPLTVQNTQFQCTTVENSAWKSTSGTQGSSVEMNVTISIFAGSDRRLSAKVIGGLVYKQNNVEIESSQFVTVAQVESNGSNRFYIGQELTPSQTALKIDLQTDAAQFVTSASTVSQEFSSVVFNEVRCINLGLK